ncbi:MAG: 7TM diverse intracellular signaling domain-containing protein [Niabella sp.]
MPRLFFILAFCIAALFCKAANEEIIYTSGTYNIKTYGTLIDKKDVLNIYDVMQRGFTTKTKNLGVTQNTIWVKINIVNRSTSDSLFLELKNPTLDDITFYTVKNLEVTDIVKTGNNYKYSHRPLPEIPNFVYPVLIEQNASATVYIRIHSNTPIQLPLNLSGSDYLLKQVPNDALLFGIYCGILLIMFVYNLFIFISVKDKSYLFYIIYILFVGFAQLVLSGYASKYFWPENQWLSSNSFLLSGVLSGVATGVFAKNFLRTSYYTPTLNLAINILISLYLSCLILHFAGSKFTALNIVNLLAATGSLLIIYTAFKIIRMGYFPARYFLLAFSVFLIAVIIYVLRTNDFLPYNNVTAHILKLGSVIQITLLSFALADKINTYRKAQNEARRDALRISKENERLVKEQNIELEKQVKARTYDLEKANTEINETLHQLKMAQSKLVDSEKMASLGQLTAGIAHEINNPINFVTSNIKPLELDIKDLFDLIKQYDQLDLNNKPEVQLQEINAFKKEIDVDYLNNEIYSLLSGIKEGATRTAEIVKNLKDFARLDQSDLKYVDINEGINSTLILVRNNFPKNMIVEKQLINTSQVECDPGKINQVFMNIITNAVQAIKAKKYLSPEKPILSLKSWQEENFVKISFKDNGIGMNANVIQKIYEPFFTTKGVGEGTGLGMSIVKGIIDNHHGDLQIISEPEKGTEFILTLPISAS